MKPKEDAWSIVVVGFWNRLIFSPAWVGKEVFQTESVQCLVPLMPTAPIVFQHNDVALAVSENRLTVTLKKYSKECLKNAVQVVSKILGMLPHTPINAIGVNFGFVEEEPSTKLVGIFGCADNGNLSVLDQDISIQTTTINRKLLWGGDVLNLAVSYDNKSVKFDANFNYQVQGAGKAEEVMKGNVESLLDKFVGMMNDVYGLVYEDGEYDK